MTDSPLAVILAKRLVEVRQERNRFAFLATVLTLILIVVLLLR